MEKPKAPPAFAPRAVRYIKLGKGGVWFKDCMQRSCLRFSDLVPHEMAMAGDWEAARRIYAAAGRTTVTDSIRELRDFYEQGEDCLWITFGSGRLWWAFADRTVSLDDQGGRGRKALAPWSCRDSAGAELRLQDLSTSLTQTAFYRRTICTVGAEAYLLRRLRAEPDPLVVRTEELSGALIEAVGDMIAALHWRDFEVLVDLIFARGGWQRVAAVGGSAQADSDLILEQPITGERAFVQIKSKANAATLADYYERFGDHPEMHRFFFACHSASGALPAPVDRRAQIWLRPELADHAVRAGLVDWLKAKHR